MTNQVIDLRNTRTTPIRERQDAANEQFLEKGNGGNPAMIGWSAYEYEKRERRPSWFLIWGGGALLFVLFGIIARSYFFVAFVVLAYIVLILYAKREPKKIAFLITPHGIQIENRLYGFSELKSFYIFDRRDTRELSLETKKVLSPFLRLPLGDADTAVIKTALAKLLPEEEHKEFLSDHIARSIGF